MTQPARLAEAVGVLDDLYDPAWAEEWDAVGLVVGDPQDSVRRVLLAVDPVMAVIEEAAQWQADLLVTHHPLLLRGVHSVATTSIKGRAVTALVRGGIALHVAHTNADVANPGVSDALAAAIGLHDLRPLRPLRTRGRHDSGLGLGRIGSLPEPESLEEFAARVARALPATAAPVRVAGDCGRPIRTVAVCGGAGDDLFDDVRAAAVDAYVTADLRHHPASEAREHGPPALVDCAHWATEWPWLADLELRLQDGLTRRGATVQTRVSTLVTDPWTPMDVNVPARQPTSGA